MSQRNKILRNIMSENNGVSKALDRINSLKRKIILVVKKNKLIGTVTDGDLRNALFLRNKNIKLKDIMNTRPKVIKNGIKNFKDEDVFKISYVPLLDEKKNLVGLESLNKIKNLKFKNHVVIFAGGFGKRLYPFTKKIPKPMLKIKNVPNLKTLIKNIKKFGFENITVTLFYKKNYFKNKLKNEKINFFEEKKPLGTAGSLSKIKYKNNLPILAINADLITDLNLKNLLFFHNTHKSDFTVSVKDKSFEIPFATVDIKNNRIIDLEEKPKRDYFFNAGIYMINQNTIKRLISKNEKIDMPDFIHRALKKKFKLKPFYHHEKWLDYGTLKEYLKIKK
jgi:dTDP-glucose pyrophosphorylase|tara:strand:- start:272 stop:1279 length:1008 start_codon:yes stop_codon:yes gene_type:complete